ncbi:hypothetical protein CXU19_11880 [Akkermansia muciniphila]|nr:hypothetical protein CXU19_11880 [Akkermansia muciniphila]PNC40173.1 hypothetical protein CXU20_02215 [Akkermansia muciniphila]
MALVRKAWKRGKVERVAVTPFPWLLRIISGSARSVFCSKFCKGEILLYSAEINGVGGNIISRHVHSAVAWEWKLD